MNKTYKITQIEGGERKIRFRHLSEESANLWLRWLDRNEPEGQAQIEPEIDKQFNTDIVAQQEKQFLVSLTEAGFQFKSVAEDFAWIVLQGGKQVCEVRFEGNEWIAIPKAIKADYAGVYSILDTIRENLVA